MEREIAVTMQKKEEGERDVGRGRRERVIENFVRLREIEREIDIE